MPNMLKAEDVQKFVEDAVKASTAELIKSLREKQTNNAPGNPAADPGLLPESRAKAAWDRAAKSDPSGAVGMGFVRYAKAIALGKLTHQSPAEAAKQLGHDDVAKALASSVTAAGGALVAEDYGSEFIEMLRPATVVRRSGVSTVPMPNGNMNLGRQNGSGQANYVGENVNAPISQQSFDQVNLIAKKLVAITPISNDLIRDASFSADAIVRRDLTIVSALREDLAFLSGDGTANTPTGLLSRVAAGNQFAAAQAGAKATVDEVLTVLAELITRVEESNIPMTRPVFYMHPRVRNFLTTLKDVAGTFYFRGELNQAQPTLLGFPVFSTTQIPRNLGVGTNESRIYFGEAPEAIIGENMAIEVEAFPGGAYFDGTAVVSGISQDQTVIRVTQRHDFALRHTTSFAIATGVKWGS